jgi:hypothetical protein
MQTKPILKTLTKKVFVDDDCDDIADQRKQLGEQHKNVPEKNGNILFLFKLWFVPKCCFTFK